MKAKDDFLIWLRDKILQNPQEPPANSWQEISDSLDLEESWNKIGQELEINSVWDRIDSRLDRYQRLRQFENISHGISLAAVMLLLFGAFWQQAAGIIQYPSSTTSLISTQEKESQEEEERSFPLTGSADPKEISQGSKNSTKEKPGETLHSEVYPIDKKEIEPIFGRSIASKVQKEEKTAEGTLPQDLWQSSFPRLSGIVGGLEEGQGFLPLANLPVKVVLPLEREKNSIFPKTYAGVGTNIKWSWLLNNKTLQAMEKSSLLTAAPNFQQDFSLLYGLRLRPRLFLQADVFLKNEVGQKYQEYRNGRFGKVEDRLAYRSIAIAVSWVKGQIGYGAMPTYNRMLAGIYGGRLYEAQEITQWEKTSRMEEFAQHHLGLMAGYEYDTYLTERFVFTYGVRTYTDLLNIYSGTESLRPTFKKTRALSLDFSVSLKYVLKK